MRYEQLENRVRLGLVMVAETENAGRHQRVS